MKSDNINLPLFIFGSLKHLLFLSNGTLPSVSETELSNRLQHLINIVEIICLGSTIDDYDHQSWRIAREYDSRFINDIEIGLKDWENFNPSIDCTCWTYAKDYVASNFKGEIVTPTEQDLEFPIDHTEFSHNIYPEICLDCQDGYINGQKFCTSWNVLRKEGCQFEYLNPGKKM